MTSTSTRARNHTRPVTCHFTMHTTQYALAARRLQILGAQGQDAEADARAFLDWLATTSRSWLIVLDDLTDLEELSRWWPPRSRLANGRALATTRLRDARLSGAGRTVVEVGTYTANEASAYLHDRFTGAGTPHLLDARAEAMVRELGHLPLALGHAASYMINEDVPCTSYLQRFTDRRARLDAVLPREADSEGYGRQITAALLLTLDAAQQCEPVGLAAAAIRLAAHLDPAGHPRELWVASTTAAYLTAHRTPPAPTVATPDPVSTDEAEAVLRVLHRYGLLTCGGRDDPRAVRVHALTARATRETILPGDLPATAWAAADALAGVWPPSDHEHPDLAAALRSNADALASCAGDLLWQPESHPILRRAGHSLATAGFQWAE
ncbi:hypothetical protein [Kitasatospora sp. NBC_01266]|uniref:hypothetical protein n=1 Tax=Kitasatospora sp. NBC_01266 TaxID=2903572 RepID=UPI002E2FE19C|nr:hypothetical protein [Kitasatospora sp. NBC_01266]